jgi:hypothetical protein
MLIKLIYKLILLNILIYFILIYFILKEKRKKKVQKSFAKMENGHL